MKIEKNIPIPKNSKYIGGRPMKFPLLKEMEIGDSICLEGEEEEYESLRSAASHYGKKYNKRFTCRKVAEKKYRCWRVE